MECPASKSLKQSIEYTLQPGEEFSFIVVLKSPVQSKSSFYTTNIVVRSPECPGDWKRVFCFGIMEVPKMVCPKEIENSDLGYKCLKVFLRRGIPTQPVKVLLANNGELPVTCQFLSLEQTPELKFIIPKDKVSLEP